MSRLDSLASIGVICSSIASKLIYPRMVSHFATTTVFAVLAAMMGGALIFWLSFAAFIAMLHYDVGLFAAITIIGCMLTIVTLVLAMVTFYHARRLRPVTLPESLTERANDMTHAFLDGWAASGVAKENVDAPRQ